MSWIYKQTEKGQYPLWTVGTDDEDWQTDSDHDTRESAANRCAYLNGAPHDYIKLKEQNEKLKEQIRQTEAWLSFNTHPDKDQIRVFRNSMIELLKSCES